MRTIFKPKMLLLISVLFSIFYVAYLYPQLPSKVASHFSSYGYADAYSSKLNASIFQIGIIVILSSSFFLLSKYLYKIPDSLINLPYKSYWLAPKRRTGSLKIISDELLKIIAITNLLLISIFQLVASANINGTFKLSSISWLFLIVYLAVITLKVIKMYRYFSNPVDRN